MQRRINRFAAVRFQILQHQVHQAAAGLKFLAVVDQLEAGVQVAVVAKPFFDQLIAEFNLFENLRIGLELDESAVGFAGHFAALFALELARLESGFSVLAGTNASHKKCLRKSVDRLGPDTIQADGELKNFIVVLGAGVDLGNAVHHLAQRNAPSEVAHGHRAALDLDVHLLAVAHDVFINRIIDDLLEQNVAAVVIMRPVPDAPDVHAGAQPDVLQRGERLDLAFVVNVLLRFGHNTNMQYKGIGLLAKEEFPPTKISSEIENPKLRFRQFRPIYPGKANPAISALGTHAVGGRSLRNGMGARRTVRLEHHVNSCAQNFSNAAQHPQRMSFVGGRFKTTDLLLGGF